MTDSDPREERKFTSLNRTVTDRQKRLLDELVEIRYASQSEAIRAAIEHLHEKAASNSERPVQEVYNEVLSISSKVEDIESDVSEVLELISSPSAREISSNKSSTDIDPANQDSVYEELVNISPATVEELAERMELSSLAVRRHVENLEDMSLIEPLPQRGDLSRYRPKPAGGDAND